MSAQTLGALQRHPDRVAFLSEEGVFTYRAVLDLVGSLQGVLSSRLARDGDHLAILSSNRVDAWCVGVAAQALGLCVTWLHPLGSLADHCAVIKDAGSRFLFIDAQGFPDHGAQLAAAMSSTTQILTIGKTATFGEALERALARAGSVTARDVSRLDGSATLIFTGGTTGRPKGVLRSNRSMSGYHSALLAAFEFPDVPRTLATSPISHIAGAKIVPTLMRGGTNVFHKRFEPEAVAYAVERDRINTAVMVPTMLYKLLDDPAIDRFDLSALELLLYGASPMAPTRLMQAIDRMGSIFAQFYGQTECYPIAILPRDCHRVDRPDLFAAAGFPTFQANVKLCDVDGYEVADGQVGEILVRSPRVMDCYLGLPDETAEALRSGWLHTGDIARRNADGCLFIVDRAKDLIISGGFNIYPREIEEALSAHPSVQAAAVVGVPDPIWGEAVTALVVSRPGMACDPQSLMSHVREARGSLVTPKRIEVVEALPMTAVGKVDKKAIKAALWQGQDRAVS